MKVLKVLVFLLVIFQFHSCKAPMYGEEVTAMSTSISQDGILYVKSWVVSGRKHVRKMAKMNALEKVLFTGVPGSSVSRPLVNNPQARELHRGYFDKLFKDPTMSTFVEVTSIDAKDRIKVNGGGYKVGVKCKVLYKMLQKDLERNGIIEKFGI